MHVIFRILTVSVLAVLSITGVADNAAAADFGVVIAKGVQEPPGLRRGDQLNNGARVQLAAGGLLILRETAGCRQHHVYANEVSVTLRSSALTGCGAARDIEEVKPQIRAGRRLSERVVLRFSGKADGYNPLSGLDDPCLVLPPMSEENGRNARRCASGYLLSGVECSGAYCDDKRLRCCPYLDGNVDSTARNYHSRWISEESGGDRHNHFVTSDFINGLSCSGRYCDNLFPHAVRSPRIRNTGACSWTPWISEEHPARGDCASGSFVAGMQCSGSYCDNLALQCCRLQPK